MTITHPSMKRARDVSNQNTIPQEEYVVDDATAEDFVEEQPMGPPAESGLIPGQAPTEMKPTIQPSPVSQPKVPEEEKNMLESLIFLGLLSKEVEVGDFKFTITTLTHREHNLLMQELYKFGEGADLFTVRTLTLAHAVKKVNGIPLEELPTDLDVETPFDKKLAIIDSLQMVVVEKLFDAYDELNDKSETTLNGEQIKNS